MHSNFATVYLLAILYDGPLPLVEISSVSVVYLGLTKAFDKLSHNKLSTVINNFGICGDL